ncbi:MAG TPA: four helix bundle protein [Candidatus Paceibacterota bacterium]|nr:four helix bundle protein [Candidatus Paceibacterota bacterium]
MKPFRFLDWEIYLSSQKLFHAVLKIVKTLPSEYRFEIGNQMIRSSLSVILNIAEGSGKKSDKELGRFLDISLGSLYETRAALDTLCLIGQLSNDSASDIFRTIDEIARQIGGFKKTLDK